MYSFWHVIQYLDWTIDKRHVSDFNYLISFEHSTPTNRFDNYVCNEWQLKLWICMNPRAYFSIVFDRLDFREKFSIDSRNRTANDWTANFSKRTEPHLRISTLVYLRTSSSCFSMFCYPIAFEKSQMMLSPYILESYLANAKNEFSRTQKLK